MTSRPDPVDIHVGARIRARRKILGVSQQGLAGHLGLTFQQIQKYERGTNRVSASMLWRVGERLSCPVPYFFEGLAGADVVHEADFLTAMYGEPGGIELAKIFTALDHTLREALLRVARGIDSARAIATAQSAGEALGHLRRVG